MACCLPTCAQGSFVPNTGNEGIGLFWVLGVLLCVLCTWGVLVLLSSLCCTRFGLLRCASYWTRPLGGGRWRYYLCNSLEELSKVHKTPYDCFGSFFGYYVWKLYMLALVGQPSLLGYDACMVYSVKGALWRDCRQTKYKTSFSPSWVFLFSRNLTKRFWGLLLWHLWIGRARHPGPPSHVRHFGVEFHNVGGWLTHGDLALRYWC